MSDRAAHDELRASLVAAARREHAPGTAHASVREQLVAAAHRELRPVRRRRRRRRATGLIAVALLGATAAAEATGLISIGEPLKPKLPGTRSADPRYSAAQPGGVELVSFAEDPARGERWAVGVFRSANGNRCALAGQVRGFSLGLVVDGRFRPYENRRRGICLTDRGPNAVWDRLVVPGRTVLYGIARPGVRRAVAFERGVRHTDPIAADGAFLFVFRGELGLDELHGDVEP